MSVVRHIKKRNTVPVGSEDIRAGRACAESVRNVIAKTNVSELNILRAPANWRAEIIHGYGLGRGCGVNA